MGLPLETRIIHPVSSPPHTATMSKKGKATKMDLASFLSSTPGTANADIYAQLPSQPGEVVP